MAIGNFSRRNIGTQANKARSANNVCKAGAEVRNEGVSTVSTVSAAPNKDRSEGEEEKAEMDTIPRRVRRAREQVWDYFACEGFKDFVPEILEGRRTRSMAANDKEADVYFTSAEVEAGETVIRETEEDITTLSETEKSNSELSEVDEAQFEGYQV